MDEFRYSEETLKQLAKGAFLVTGGGSNIMTIGWGSLSVYWRKPVFIAPVRHSRYSFELLEKGTEFTVSVPFEGDMQKQLSLCGSLSGRDTDKFSAAGLEKQAPVAGSTPVVKGCSVYYECRILGSADLPLSGINPEISDTFYASGDIHRLYFGEIAAVYKA